MSLKITNMVKSGYNFKWDSYSLQDFQQDPSWTQSFGEKLTMIHFRNGHWHAECNSFTGECKIHYDKVDPHKSITSLVNHMSESNLGLSVLAVIGVGVLDQIFTGGQLRKSLLGSL